MSVWVLILITTSAGGALVMWHSVARCKSVSEEMLRSYAQMLRAAREQRARDLEAQAAAEVEHEKAVANGKPTGNAAATAVDEVEEVS
jgi:hypothetical protein